MRKIKTILLCFLISIFCAISVGCGAKIEIYDNSNAMMSNKIIIMEIDNNLMQQLNNSNENFGSQKMTLVEYLKKLADLFGCYMDAPANRDNKCIISFSQVLPNQPDDVEESQQNQETDEQVKQEIKKGFFFHEITITQPSPFKGLRQEFDNPTSSTTSIVSVVKNGYEAIGLEGIEEIFPAIKNTNYDNLELEFYFKKGPRISSDELPLENGYFVYKTNFSGLDKPFSYTKKVANSIVWNSIYIIIGLIVVGIIVIVALKLKQKPKMIANNTREYKLKRAYEIEQQLDLDKEQQKKDLDDIFGLDDNDDPNNKNM